MEKAKPSLAGALLRAILRMENSTGKALTFLKMVMFMKGKCTKVR